MDHYQECCSRLWDIVDHISYQTVICGHIRRTDTHAHKQTYKHTRTQVPAHAQIAIYKHAETAIGVRFIAYNTNPDNNPYSTTAEMASSTCEATHSPAQATCSAADPMPESHAWVVLHPRGPRVPTYGRRARGVPCKGRVCFEAEVAGGTDPGLRLYNVRMPASRWMGPDCARVGWEQGARGHSSDIQKVNHSNRASAVQVEAS